MLSRTVKTATRLFILSAVGWFGAVTAPGCGSGSQHDNSVCAPGRTNSCSGPSGCHGVQTCNASGLWNPCVCDDDPTNKPLLGTACSNDSECPNGASCLLPTSTAWLGGGPPAGLCVAECTDDIERCASLFANAVCVSAARAGTSDPKHAFCMPTCDLTLGTADSLACSSVPASACDQLEQGTDGFCRPFCRFDSDCVTGHCDRQVGSCVVAAPPPKTIAFGETCDPASLDCDGVCLSMVAAAAGTPGAAVCTNRCVFGTVDECAIAGADPIAGVCAYAAQLAKPGNAGYCTPLCNCNDDCKASEFVCQAFSTEGPKVALKHAGMCVPLADLTGSAIPCGIGG